MSLLLQALQKAAKNREASDSRPRSPSLGPPPPRSPAHRHRTPEPIEAVLPSLLFAGFDWRRMARRRVSPSSRSRKKIYSSRTKCAAGIRRALRAVRTVAGVRPAERPAILRANDSSDRRLVRSDSRSPGACVRDRSQACSQRCTACMSTCKWPTRLFCAANFPASRVAATRPPPAAAAARGR